MLSKTPLVSLGIMALLNHAVALGPAIVKLGSAGNFAVLAKSGVATVPSSIITGDVGISPIASSGLTGFSLIADASGRFWTSTQVSGHLMGATDAPPTPSILTSAVMDMQDAYTDAMGRTNPAFIGFHAGLLGATTLSPGLYKWSTGVRMLADIILIGSAADTWIFQISGTFDQAAATRMILQGGALSSNIIWAVAGSVTVGAGATFQGNILAKTNVVLQTGAIDFGCIYAQTDVALQKATVSCNGGPLPTTTPTPTPTDTVTATPTSTRTAPHCPPTPTAPCYTTTFANLTASVDGDDYLTYILVDSIDECINTCNCRSECGFVNAYHDHHGAQTTSQLTCAMYKGCHQAKDVINFGGQTQPDGSLSSRSESDGYCLCPVE